MMIMPGFASSYVNVQVRLAVSLAVTVVLMPAIAPMLPPQPADMMVWLPYIMSEITIGLFMGVVMQILYFALSLAGNITGQAIGFANAQIFDPTFQTQSIVIEAFFNMAAITLIFVTDIHHLMLSAVVDSYHLFAVGAPLPWADFADDLSQKLNASFIMGFKLGSPFVAFSLVFYVGMGLVSRLMPQLNIFFLSLPLQIYLGLGLLFITLPMMIVWFLKYYQDGLNAFVH